MKKAFALALLIVMVVGFFAGCGEKEESGSDMAAVQDRGKLVVGITDYYPMDFKDDEGNWSGFDAEFAQLFAKELNVECEFLVLADWGKKFYELESGNIDAIWNGMTISDEVMLNTSCSDPYVQNAQVVVMKADKLKSYPDTDSLKDVTIAVENGSAGKDAAEAIGAANIVPVQDQTAALMEVAAGTSDACVIDITLALGTTGEGKTYEDLGVGLSLTSEEYGVGFRKDSDMTAKLNELMAKWKTDGTLTALAEKYDLTLAD